MSYINRDIPQIPIENIDAISLRAKEYAANCHIS